MRPSFQGLSVVDGKRGQSGQKKKMTSDQIARIARLKTQRRRKSMEVLVTSAQSERIREMLGVTMESALEGIIVEGSPEERLHTVMTRAKEKGMSAESIFNFFNGGNPNTTEITKESFLEALEKLGKSLIVMTDEELKKLVKKFDLNGDGLIDISEFKNYCYHQIPSVAWKAERQRMERSGEMAKLKAQLSRRFSGKMDPSENKFSSGEMVHLTSKLFWRTNTNLNVRLYHCTELDVITMQVQDQNTNEELGCIYVCKERCEGQLDDALNEAVKTAVQTSDTRAKDDEVRVKKEAYWGCIGKFLMARLKLPDAPNLASIQSCRNVLTGVNDSEEAMNESRGPYLCKLTGDTFDTLVIPKPLNLSPPPKDSVAQEKSLDEFQAAFASFKKASKSARTSRQSAQDISNLVNQALAEVEIEDAKEL